MKEATGDLWAAHKKGNPICITTNGMVRKDGACVMGRGIALQAAERWPAFPFKVGNSIRAWGNHVQYFQEYNVFIFPVKHHWKDAADLALIRRSAEELKKQALKCWDYIYLPRAGCGNGRLDWKDVKPVLAEILDDRFVVMQL